MQFYHKSREAGFTAKEATMLRGLALHCGLENPMAVFSSKDGLDMCIRLLAGDPGGDEKQAFLFKLYDWRRKMEIGEQAAGKTVSNSCQLKPGQILRLSVDGVGAFKSQIIKNTSGYMTVSRPANQDRVFVKDWRDLEISVHFWAEGDAGYVFDTVVKDEVYSLGIYSLKIAHSFSLSRVQKRRSVRTKLNVPAFLYLVSEGEAFHRVEAAAGVRCMLEDLSDTGFAVTVGGRADSGLRIKVQFSLNGAPVCMSGTVRAAVYREDTDRSVLRVEADPMPLEARNQILAKTFGITGGDDDRHFRSIDEEAAGVTEDTVIPEEDYDAIFHSLAEEDGDTANPGGGTGGTGGGTGRPGGNTGGGTAKPGGNTGRPGGNTGGGTGNTGSSPEDILADLASGFPGDY